MSGSFKSVQMECLCAQTRPRFILSPQRDGVLGVLLGFFFGGGEGGRESEPMLTPREKSLLPETIFSVERPASRRTVSPAHYRLSYSGP